MQSRLKGVGREWYENLRNYQYMWEEWKTLLRITFPEARDHAQLLDKIKDRKKYMKPTSLPKEHS